MNTMRMMMISWMMMKILFPPEIKPDLYLSPPHLHEEALNLEAHRVPRVLQEVPPVGRPALHEVLPVQKQGLLVALLALHLAHPVVHLGLRPVHHVVLQEVRPVVQNVLLSQFQ